MRPLLLIAMLVVAGFAIDRAEQHGDTGFVHEKADQAFVQSAAANLMAGTEWSEIAARAAAAISVKALAAHTVSWQRDALRELRVLASARGIAVPLALEEDHGEARDRLVAADGATLGPAYTSALIRLQQGSLALFEHEAAVGLDPELRTWAATRLPELRDQLHWARAARP